MRENPESVRNQGIGKFIRTEKTAMELLKMLRNSVCSPRGLFYLRGPVLIILPF